MFDLHCLAISRVCLLYFSIEPEMRNGNEDTEKLVVQKEHWGALEEILYSGWCNVTDRCTGNHHGA